MREPFLIGDVHGCFEELLEIMTYVNPTTHRVIFLGDILDRGPESYKCLEYVKRLCIQKDAECVLGNHEQKHIRYWGHEIQKELTGKDNPMRRMSLGDLIAHDEMTEEDINWLRDLPLSIHIQDNWHAIHGGLEPARSFAEQSPNQIIRCRYVGDGSDETKKGKAVSLCKNYTQPDNTIYWAEMWNGPESIIFGHFVNSLSKPLVEEKPNGVKCIGLDTGCVFGGHLTGYLFNQQKFIQVKAKKEYCKKTFEFED